MKKLLVVMFTFFSFVSFSQETAEDLYKKGYEASNNGNYEKAVDYFTKCISKNRKAQAPYWSRGFAYLRQGMTSEALSDINQAIEFNPNSDKESLSKLYSLRGEIYFNTRNFKEAISDYTKATSNNTKSFLNYWYLGLCYYNLKDNDNALKNLETCENLINVDDKDNLARLYNLLASINQQMEKPDVALNFYSKSIIVKPLNNDAYLNRGYLYNKLLEHQKAIADLTEALNIFKTDNKIKSSIYLYRGYSYAEINELEKAIFDFTQCISIEPNQYAYHNRGDANRKLGNYKNAIEDFSKAIELGFNKSRTFALRAKCKVFENDLNGAMIDYNKAIEVEPDYAYNYMDRGRLKMKIFGLDIAKSDFEKAAEIDKENLNEHSSLPYALFFMGKYQEALNTALKIIDKKPSYANYYDLACIYSLANNKKEAIHNLELAIEKGFKVYSHMANDNDLNNIKFTKEFNSFLVSHNINVEIPIPISDIDILIPETKLNYKTRFALIIGNEDYSSYQPDLEKEVNVDYARNDAQSFKEYSIKVLGIPEKNITMLTNATAAQIMQGIDKLSKLASVTLGKAEIFFYYAGHGIANQETKESYLIPVDVNGSNLQFAVKVQDVYNKLTEFPTQKTIVFLDACFSGGARNKELLSLRGVKVKPKANSLKGNIIVFASSSDTESSLPYNEKKHGLFTYFFLKKIQDTQGNLTFKELFDYTKENVSLESIINKNQSQTPTLIISPDVEKTWSNWKLN